MNPRRRGFTLVEILVVIIIIGILASLTLVGVMGALRQARRSSTQNVIEQLRAACESYRVRWGDYPPTSLAEFKAKMPNDTNNGAEALCACLSSQDRGGVLYQPPDAESYGNVDGDKAEKNITNWYFGDNALREFLDLYRMPITYIHHKDYVKASGPLTRYKFKPDGDETSIKPAKTEATKTYANPDKFQIFSAGQDGIPGNGDDVVGW